MSSSADLSNVGRCFYLSNRIRSSRCGIEHRMCYWDRERTLRVSISGVLGACESRSSRFVFEGRGGGKVESKLTLIRLVLRSNSMAEMILGYPLFRGRDNNDQLTQIMRIVGTPDEKTLRKINADSVSRAFLPFPPFPPFWVYGAVDQGRLGSGGSYEKRRTADPSLSLVSFHRLQPEIVLRPFQRYPRQPFQTLIPRAPPQGSFLLSSISSLQSTPRLTRFSSVLSSFSHRPPRNAPPVRPCSSSLGSRRSLPPLLPNSGRRTST